MHSASVRLPLQTHFLQHHCVFKAGGVSLPLSEICFALRLLTCRKSDMIPDASGSSTNCTSPKNLTATLSPRCCPSFVGFLIVVSFVSVLCPQPMITGSQNEL